MINNKIIKRLGCIVLMASLLTGCEHPYEEVYGEYTDICIDVITMSQADSYWKNVEYACTDMHSEIPMTINYYAPETENDIDQQIKLVKDSIDRDVDAIIIAPLSQDGLNDVLDEAYNKGIDIFTIDSNVTYENVLCAIGTDNIAGSSIAASEVVQILETSGYYNSNEIPLKPGETSNKSRNSDEHVLVLSHSEAIGTSMDRYNGFTDTLNAKGIGFREDAYNGDSNIAYSKVMDAIKDSTFNLKVIYTTNQPGTQGASEAVKDAIDSGLIDSGDVLVVGYDFFDGAEEYIESGILYSAVVQKPYNMGYIALRYAMYYALDDQEQIRDIEPTVNTGVILVNSANYKDDDVLFYINPKSVDSSYN